MKKILLGILFLTISITMSAQKYVAVSKPVSKGDVSEVYSSLIKNNIITALAASKEYQAIDRDVAMTEMMYDLASGVNDTVKKLGSMKAADYVLITELSTLGDALFISMRLQDVKTGMIAGMAKEFTEMNPKNVQSACEKLAKQLFGDKK